MRVSLIKDNAKKNIKKVLAGDENKIARLAKKAYVGVDGIAKLFWGGIDIPDEQLVNYLMLYDGSLGEAGENGANVCANVTGGYAINDILTDDTYEPSDVTFGSTQVSLSAKKTIVVESFDGNKMATILTQNSFDISEYKQIGCVAHANLYSPAQYNWFTVIIMQNRGIISGAVMGEYYFIVNSVDIKNGLNNTKFIKSIDISNATNKDYYFAVQISSTYYNNSATASLYSAFLVKQDNWQELCTIAGLNSSDYANEETLCANSTAITQILSNASAVDFMLKQCTGTFMYYFVRSSTCLTALNNSTNKTKIHANGHWSKFLNFVA